MHSSAKEDAIYVSVNKQRKKREGSKRRMSKQAKKATDLVQSGHVLTRAGISALTKAEARTYLSAIKGSSGRANRSELLDAIRSVFDAKEIDVFVVELSRRRFVLMPPLFDLLCHNESPKPPCQAPQNSNMASEAI